MFLFVKFVKYCVYQCFNKELLTYLLTYLGIERVIIIIIVVVVIRIRCRVT